MIMIRWAKEIREVVLSFFLGSVVVGIISWKERIDRYFSNICVWHCLGYLCNICARHLDICVIFVLGTRYLDILDISAIFVLGVEIFVQYLCLPVGCCCNPPSTTGTTLTSLSVYTNGATLQNKETQMGQHRKTKKHRCDNTAQKTKIHRWCSNPA